MAKKDDEILESQIGSIGSETQSLGKLKNMDLIGGKESLSEEEKKSLDIFNKRTNKQEQQQAEEDGVISFNSISTGWVPIDKSVLGKRNIYYPEDWQFRVRPATVEAIKNWSAIDDSNIYTINNVFNEVIKQCVSIQTPQGAISWGKMNSWDRFAFMVLVREYSFMKGENIIKYDEECPECGGTITYTLDSNSLCFDFPDDEVVEKHWNRADRCWYINPSDYGLEGYGMIKLFCPTLEKDAMILNWSIRKYQKDKKEPNQSLLNFLPWMIERATKDEEAADKIIEKAIATYKSWDAEIYTFLDEVRRNIIVTPKDRLKTVCPHCGEAVKGDVQFPDGVRNLFNYKNRFKKFGSK